jgi:hypothetical protein
MVWRMKSRIQDMQIWWRTPKGSGGLFCLEFDLYGEMTDGRNQC